MVILRGSNEIKNYVSDVVYHPLGSRSTQSVGYVVTHNLGVIPDIVKLHYSGSAVYTNDFDDNLVMGGGMGYRVVNMTTTTVTVYVNALLYGPGNLYFKVYACGGVHR